MKKREEEEIFVKPSEVKLNSSYFFMLHNMHDPMMMLIMIRISSCVHGDGDDY